MTLGGSPLGEPLGRSHLLRSPWGCWLQGDGCTHGVQALNPDLGGFLSEEGKLGARAPPFFFQEKGKKASARPTR